ncbi:hypothetical protein N7447_007602 [Penicillium robsamsonii]|uniref:uncharacterized protein n=1 Tax=Penicillium robsamsonii TaxID=1792511 RepID=UPI0025466992|nr:uncharacterized protein N7447_007602 [Penicillium robsamsonii]KAJ5817594.1 hypothetical protein N7447_007602 [Penicillium robsamsonii]
MASSQPDSPSDSEHEAIPESPPMPPSLHHAPPSLHDAIPESYTFPLPPLPQQYDTPEQGIVAINIFGRQHGYAVSTLRSKRTKKGVLKTDDQDSCLTARDIYNFRRKLHVDFLAGRTPLQALLIELPKDGEWIFKYEVNDENHVTALFCMHKTSIAFLKTNSWVILMDCTYKTNRYGLLMLDIVGFTATGSTFYIGFAFIKDEKDDSYEVILSCLAEAYEALSL